MLAAGKSSRRRARPARRWTARPADRLFGTDQQTPIPPGGTIIKRKWLTTYDEIASRPDDRIVISWDIALSETESGDYSACVVLLIRKEIVYILELVRGRFPFEALKKEVMELKRKYNPSTLLIEDSPISLGLIQSLRVGDPRRGLG